MLTFARLFAIALVVASSANAEPDYSAIASRIGEVGYVPPELKLAAAKMLVRCGVLVNGRHIYRHQHGTIPYTLELTISQFETRSVKSCLNAQARALNVESQMSIGEEAPAAPRRMR
jgi:hypothetical protein